MIDSKLTSAVLIVCTLSVNLSSTCTQDRVASLTTPVVDVVTCNPTEASMAKNDIIIHETAQPTISGYLVGVSNIWNRELPDNKGVVSRRLSANLSIQELASKQTRTEKVFVGSVLTLGLDSYCVVNVEEGYSAPGTITLRKIQ